MNKLLRLALSASALCLLAVGSIAQEGNQELELSETLRGAQQDWDSYGDHVAFDEQWLIVGAPREDVTDINTGAVYIYKRTDAGPLLHQKLIGLVDFDVGTRFGAGFELLSEHLLISVANDQNFQGDDPWQGVQSEDDPPFSFAGKVYYFRHDPVTDQWVNIQELTSPSPGSYLGFGGRTDSNNVALIGDTAIIGESGATGFGRAVHVFQRDDTRADPWQLIQTIGPQSEVPSDPWLGPKFGDKVVAVGTKHILVTERVYEFDEADELVSLIPYIHVYEQLPTGLLNPVPIQTISPIGETPLGCLGGFGYSGIGAGGSTVVVGDSCDSTNSLGAVQSGALYVYDYDAESTQPINYVQKLFHPAPIDYQYLGFGLGSGRQSIDTDGEMIAVGSSWALIESDPVEVLVFRRDSLGAWAPAPQLIANPESPDPFGSDFFGQSVTILDNGDVAIGNTAGGPPFGRLHIFSQIPIPVRLLTALVDNVASLNLHHGIENSLDAKLESALASLQDVQLGNDDAAINKLEAFINAVEAQRGGQITDENADLLISAALEIIDNLSG